MTTTIPAAPRGRNRAALITGAARGLGRTIALSLADDTRALVLADIDKAGLTTLSDELSNRGYAVATQAVDLSEPENARQLIEFADDVVGGVDVLINNAGLVNYADFLDTEPDMLRALLRVDVESLYYLTQNFVRSLQRRQSGGSVVNLGTGHAMTGVAGTTAYAAAKGAVHALTRALAVEIAPLGIRVNTLALGTTMTDRVRRELPAELLAQRTRQIPLRRGAEPDEAAQAVAYLLEAEYATGTELVLDGGFTIYGDG